ncbi:unnamed protein product, partial [Ectocarpus sp. 12 AP-2014]
TQPLGSLLSLPTPHLTSLPTFSREPSGTFHVRVCGGQDLCFLTQGTSGRETVSWVRRICGHSLPGSATSPHTAEVHTQPGSRLTWCCRCAGEVSPWVSTTCISSGCFSAG